MYERDIEELCNKIENIIEPFVIDNKGRLFQNGMEKEIEKMFYEYVKIFLNEQSIKFEDINLKHKELIQKRLDHFLKFAKKIYYS